MDQKQILDRLNTLPGYIGFYYLNLTTGESLSFQEDELFESASVIKLPMFAAIQKWHAEGSADLKEKLTFTEADKFPSCGALQFFPTPMEVNIETLCKLMITLSDNTATNLLIRRFGMDAFNAEFRRMGLKKSRIERYLFDAEASARGLENRVTPKEMGALLEQIYRRAFVSEDVSAYMEDVLLRQQIKHKIRGYLPKSIPSAHKTGEDNGITNDVGIVYSDSPFVVCWLTNRTDVPEAEKAIREITLELTKNA